VAGAKAAGARNGILVQEEIKTMYYVIYNSTTKQYLNEDMYYGSYKVVGPCKEGEEP